MRRWNYTATLDVALLAMLIGYWLYYIVETSHKLVGWVILCALIAVVVMEIRHGNDRR